jgi:hypothetical protein
MPDAKFIFTECFPTFLIGSLISILSEDISIFFSFKTSAIS